MRTLLINMALCALFGILALAGLEVTMRLTIPASSTSSIYEYTLETRRYKLMKPDAVVTAWGKELRTNRLGFRDHKSSVAPKRQGEFRIVVLGDSFTVSAGVDYRDMYTSLVRERLQARFPQVSLINLAVGGYNIIQYELVLREVGLGLEPDMVVVALFPPNDFMLDNYEENYRVASGQKSAIAPEPAWHETLYVYQAYLSKVEGRIRRMLREPPPARPGREEAGWERNAAALKAIAELSRERGLELAVALLPHTWHFERQQERFERVEALCAEYGLACLSLLDAFVSRGVPEPTLRLNALDSHPNERYNAVVAGRLAPWLARFLVEAPPWPGAS